jgi:chemotaxis signal transduction protein
MMGSIDSDFIEGVAKLDDRLLIVLDLEKLFGEPNCSTGASSPTTKAA